MQKKNWKKSIIKEQEKYSKKYAIFYTSLLL